MDLKIDLEGQDYMVTRATYFVNYIAWKKLLMWLKIW